MTAVENRLMMILMRLTLLDSAKSGPPRSSGATQLDSKSGQDKKITSMPSLDTPRTRGERGKDSKPPYSESSPRLCMSIPPGVGIANCAVELGRKDS